MLSNGCRITVHSGSQNDHFLKLLNLDFFIIPRKTAIDGSAARFYGKNLYNLAKCLDVSVADLFEGLWLVGFFDELQYVVFFVASYLTNTNTNRLELPALIPITQGIWVYFQQLTDFGKREIFW